MSKELLSQRLTDAGQALHETQRALDAAIRLAEVAAEIEEESTTGEILRSQARAFLARYRDGEQG